MKPLALLGLRSAFILCAWPAFAPAVTVTSSADKTQLFLNESFVFTIKITSQEEIPENIQIPDLSYLNDFHLLDDWAGRESSFQISGGGVKSSQTLSKNWRFQPKTIGKLRIEPLKIKVGGKEFQTAPVFITVNKGGPGPSAGPPPLPKPLDLPHKLLPDILNPLSQNSGKTKREHIKFLPQLNKKAVYINESLAVSWILFSSAESLQNETEKYPNLKGFLKEEPEHRSSFIGTQVIDKVLYQKISVNKFYLFPLQSGRLEIDPYKVRVRFPLKIYFSRLFSPWKIYSSPVEAIRVKNLPLKGRELSSWTGAVGSFKIKASVSQTSAQTNEPISYKITFSGNGHPQFIKLPDLRFPPFVRLWPPSEKSNFSSSGEGFKEFSFLIAPLKEGLLEIPSYRLSFFDPELKRYVFHQTKSFLIPVKKGASSFEKNESYFLKGTAGDKGPPPPSLSFRPLSLSLKPAFLRHKSLVFLEIALLIFLASVWGFLLAKRLISYRETSLKEDLLKELKTAQGFLNKKQFKKASLRLISVNYSLLYSLQEKKAAASSFLNWRQALAKLPPGLQKKHAPMFKSLFHELEVLSFAPQREEKSPQSLLNKTQDLLKQTENLIAQVFLNEGKR